MLITDKKLLESYKTDKRLWQGIPSIEVTVGGRIFLTYYSGEKGETLENYSILSVSDDGGESFSEPVAVAYLPHHRCFDPCLFIDTTGALWWTFSTQPNQAVWAAVCRNPDAENIIFEQPRVIGHDIMMNKPTVLSTGEWLFPIAVWQRENMFLLPFMDSRREEGAFAYKTVDNGETFIKLGGALAPREASDCTEHMILELSDGVLASYIRTKYGIGVSYSYNRGKTWSEVTDSGLGGPTSRFFISRLKSGRILLINHYNYSGRNNLTALLSEDDGKTFPHSLMLDERDWVSYPDAKEEGGFIHVTYDRERGDGKKSFAELYSSAREILYAKITEEDIIAGEIRNPESRLKVVASKLGKYFDERQNPYRERSLYTPESAAKMLSECYRGAELIDKIFEIFPPSGQSFGIEEIDRLDTLLNELRDSDTPRDEQVGEVISILLKGKSGSLPVIELAKNILTKNLGEDIPLRELARQCGCSYNYIAHVFKRQAGITLTEYKNELKLTEAKKLLLGGDMSMTDIAYACGFSSASYFAEVFSAAEGITPTQYRKLHSVNKT